MQLANGFCKRENKKSLILQGLKHYTKCEFCIGTMEQTALCAVPKHCSVGTVEHALLIVVCNACKKARDSDSAESDGCALGYSVKL